MKNGVMYRLYLGEGAETETTGYLRLPEHLWDNKENSRQLANNWWTEKMATITVNPAVESAIRDRRQMLQAAAMLDLPMGQWLPTEIRQLEGATEVPPGIDPEIQGGEPNDQKILWLGRVQMLNRVTPTTKTLGSAKDAYMQLRRADDLTPGAVANLARNLSCFVGLLGAESATDAVNENDWQRFNVHLRSQVKAGAFKSGHAGKLQTEARKFVRWAWNMRMIDALPRNLEDCGISFTEETPAIPTFTKEEVRTLIDHATGQLKLHLLLMANTGATQIDISDLRHDQIDLKTGTISRKRSKTSDHENVPVVTWKLWRTTVSELKKHLSSDPEIALLTTSGKRWKRSALKEGDKEKKTDNIATNFRRLRKKTSFCGPGKSLKVFRKTSASLIDDSEHAGLAPLFLGHSARTVADKNYVKPTIERLAKACEWLGKQYGIK